MTEPIYDEDVVNLGYLKKVLNNDTSNATSITISRHFTSKPNPPYYAGDTWKEGSILYTCVNTRTIGFYNENDWTTESGAREEAESKNKIYLSKPINYRAGDMWILQSDDDHKAGKKGEILIAIAGQSGYEEDDWINMLGYGTIRSINEVANNLKDALRRLNATKTDGVVTIFYEDEIPATAINNDLWYVTNDVDGYIRENVYKYNNNVWEKVTDRLAIVAFEEANEARLVNDGKIKSFYLETEPTDNMGVGDIWTNTVTKKLYRYNGTNWVAVYDTNISELRKDLETITEITTSIQTDLGRITQEVSAMEIQVADLGYKNKVEDITELYIENLGEGHLLRLEIEGNAKYETNLYPKPNLYCRANLQPNMKGG